MLSLTRTKRLPLLLIIVVMFCFIAQTIDSSVRSSAKAETAPMVIWDLDELTADSQGLDQRDSTQAELLEFDLPKYPKKARFKKLSGMIKLSLTISNEGKVEESSVCESSGHEVLDKSAKKAVKSFKFKPATMNGQPVSASVLCVISFVDNEATPSTESDSKLSFGSRFVVDVFQDFESSYRNAPVIKFHPQRIDKDSTNLTAIKMIMVVSKEGKVTDARALETSGSTVMDLVARTEALKFKFSPSLVCGQPTVCGVNYTISVAPIIGLPTDPNDRPGPDDFVAVEIPAEMIKPSTPRYPKVSRDARIQGVVWVSALVLKDGSVGKAQVAKTSGSSELDQAALEAALKNKFTPGIHNGKPVAMWVTYKVAFELQ